MRLACQPPRCLSLLALSLATHSSVTMASRLCIVSAWTRLRIIRQLAPSFHMCVNFCRWHNRKDWNALIRNGMTSDLSWDRAAKDYEQIFNWALMDPPQA